MVTTFLALPSWYWFLLLAISTLAIGSFLNVIVYRLPLILRQEWIQDCRCLLGISEEESSPISLSGPRSFCPNCKQPIRYRDNIPFFSYVFLKGQCSQCKQSISIRYPLTEIITCLLSLFTAWYMGFTAQLAFALVFIWILIPLFLIDWQHQLLPDCLTLGLLWLGLIANSFTLFTHLTDAVYSSVAAYLFLWLFIKIYARITGKIGMGHGDFKLFAAFGAWFGWILLPFILLLACLCGTVFGIIFLRWQKLGRDTSIAFGPYLCISGLIALLWGQDIMHWYISSW